MKKRKICWHCKTRLVGQYVYGLCDKCVDEVQECDKHKRYFWDECPDCKEEKEKEKTNERQN